MRHGDGLTASERLRLERGAEHLHQLGPRPTAELLAEVAEQHGAGFLLRRLADYGRLKPSTVRRLGADRFAPRPLHLVPRS